MHAAANDENAIAALGLGECAIRHVVFAFTISSRLFILPNGGVLFVVGRWYVALRSFFACHLNVSVLAVFFVAQTLSNTVFLAICLFPDEINAPLLNLLSEHFAESPLLVFDKC